MKKIFTGIGVVSLVFALYGTTAPQEDRKIELNAQGILARVDKIFEYPRGLLKGMLKHIKPDGTAATLNFTACVSQEDFLFTFIRM